MGTYTVEKDIGRFGGLGQTGKSLWITDAKALRDKLFSVNVFWKAADVRILIQQFQSMIPRAEKLLEDPTEKGIILQMLNNTNAAIPGWKDQIKAKQKNWRWLSTKLGEALGNAIKIAEGKAPIYQRPAEVVTKTEVVTKYVTVPEAVKVPTEPLIPEKKREEPKPGIPTAAYLVGAGALVLGFMMFGKKK